MDDSHWKWLYSVAADVPKTPSPNTIKKYYDFFKTLGTVIPETEERRAYKKIVSSGPFQIASAHFSDGPEKALQWIVDVRNGVLVSMKKKPRDDASELWKLLKYSRSQRDAVNDTNTNTNNTNTNGNLNISVISKASELESRIKSNKLTVVLFDVPHYYVLLHRLGGDKLARMGLTQLRARFAIDALIVPSRLSFRWYFSNPFSSQHVSKFPWFRVYRQGKVIVESHDIDDIKRLLKQRVMRNSKVVYTSVNNNRRKTPASRGLATGLASGVGRGVGEHLGSKAVGGAHMAYKLAKVAKKLYF